MKNLKNINKAQAVKYLMLLILVILSVTVFAAKKGFFDGSYMSGDDPIEKAGQTAEYAGMALAGIITIIGLVMVNKNNFNWVETIMMLIGGFILFLVIPGIMKKAIPASGSMIDRDMVQSSISYTAVKAKSLKHILSENMIDTDMVQSCISCTTEKVNSFIS